MIISDQLGDPMKKRTRPTFSPEFRLEASQLVVDRNYTVRAAAQASITRYIVGYYSEHRPHQHNGGLPPNKAEAKYNLVSYTVASFT